jgi:hypothetical protein
MNRKTWQGGLRHGEFERELPVEVLGEQDAPVVQKFSR